MLIFLFVVVPLYAFAGYYIGDLVNLLEIEQNKNEYDNRVYLSILWLPICLWATLDRLKRVELPQLSPPIELDQSPLESVPKENLIDLIALRGWEPEDQKAFFERLEAGLIEQSRLIDQLDEKCNDSSCLLDQ